MEYEKLVLGIENYKGWGRERNRMEMGIEGVILCCWSEEIVCGGGVEGID